jgi:hypothetical protein
MARTHNLVYAIPLLYHLSQHILPFNLKKFILKDAQFNFLIALLLQMFT